MVRLCSLLLLAFLISPSAAAQAFPVDPRHPLVAKQLDYLSGTAKGRRDVSEALARLDVYRSLIDPLFKRHGVPRELMAIAVVESRVRNLAQKENFLKCCAGVWQLHRVTAKLYGLRVGGVIDERLSLERSSEVAVRHLADLHADFGDWPSAVTAYNVGASRLRDLYREDGVKDPWHLMRRGRIGEFLGKVGAVVIIMRQRGALASVAREPCCATAGMVMRID
jgi:membrane-bound lytic murein transglycosylase D